MTLFDLFRARADEHPDEVAVIFGDARITYAQLAAEVDRVARGLQHRGVRRGDRVLVLAGNVPEVFAIYLAVGRIGGVYVPLSTGFREREVGFVLDNAAPKLAVVAAAHLADFLSWSKGRPIDVLVLGEGEAPADLSRFEDLCVGGGELREIEVQDEDGVLLCYTSGTTATPKPVLHSHRSEVYNATTYAEVWKLGPGDRGIVALPLAWVYGLSTTSAALLVSGGTIVLLERFHPVAVLDAIETHQASAMWGTMSMYTKVLEVIKDRGPVDLGSLRVVVNGGEPCPPPLVKEFERRTGVQLLGSYATSEARPIMVVRPGDVAVPDGSVGQLVPGAEIRLERLDGTAAPVGEAGHALLRCPGLMTEYYREPELTADRVTADGWLRTGDLLRADDEGYYYVVGRQSDMIIRSGANVAPAEVEAVLVAHPFVLDAAVVGVQDDRSGEAIRAVLVVEPESQLSTDELRSHMSDQLAAYKVPQEFIFVDELPRTANGKVDRLALRNLERNPA